MKYSENAINILTTLSYKGIGRAWIVKNFGTKCPDIYEIISMLNNSKKNKENFSLDEFLKKRACILGILQDNSIFVDGIVALGDPEFPQHRGYVKNSDRPVFLFYKGDISLLQKGNRNITVIGLLNPDTEIEDNENLIVSKLVEEKFTIISGLALGCDTIAHEKTLAGGGKTIAILPSPISAILPSSNKRLADTIVKKGGLLISEYVTEAKSKNILSSRYQERDRLQALFCDGIILSASYAVNDKGNDCGSRLAMQYAKEYRIRRALIYSDEFEQNPKFDLNRQYIKEDQNITIINKMNYCYQLKEWLVDNNNDYFQPSLFES